MPFGKQIGPTGRKRDEFSVLAENKQKKVLTRNGPGSGIHRQETLKAYGREGVKEAKHSVHKKHPHTWVKFGVYNHSRTHRMLEKRRKQK